MKMYRTSAAAAVASLALVLTACGGATKPAASASDGKLEKTKVSVGVLPTADYATVYWADQHGFFQKAGLEVSLEPLQGGPVGVQKVAAGELDFSFSNSVSSTIAQSKHAPITTVVLDSSLGSDSLGIFVKPDSPIRDMADLNGKSVGVNTTNNIGDVSFANLAGSKGLDVKPRWIEVPFNEMINGVKAGSIDAGYVPEPFKSAAEAAGLRQVVDLSSGVNSEMAAATFVASDSFVRKNPDTVKAFASAMYAANADIASKQDEFRSWLPKVARVDERTASTMSIPVFATSMSLDKLQKVGEMLVKQGLVDKSFSIADHTYVPKS